MYYVVYTSHNKYRSQIFPESLKNELVYYGAGYKQVFLRYLILTIAIKVFWVLAQTQYLGANTVLPFEINTIVIFFIF